MRLEEGDDGTTAATRQGEAGGTPSSRRTPPEDRAAHLETLYRLTNHLYRASDRPAMLSAALDAITEGLGCERCSILLFDAEGVMRFVAWRGLSDHYRTTLEGHTPWSPGTVDPPPIYVPDIDASDEVDEVKRVIRDEGIRCLAFIPITSQGRVIGKFMAYHPEPHDYSDAAKALALTIARQLGFSLERAQAPEVVARYAEHTDTARALGLFGAPTFVHEGRELFWGDDRLEEALDWACAAAPSSSVVDPRSLQSSVT
jgi:GAF domain-containing protein